jgi:hypothetical protein
MSLPFELPKDHKSSKKKYWKCVGVNMDNFDEIYDRYIHSSQCELCYKIYDTNFNRCLDHCHTTGKFRNVVCRTCNLNLRKQKFNNNTGEQYICKVNNKRSKTGYYYQIKIQRNKIRLVDKARSTLESAILLRDNFIKENPSLFT